MKHSAINRGQFLKELGLSSSALMAFYCLGTVTSGCSKKDDPAAIDPSLISPSPGGGNTKIDFTIDLSSAEFSKLKTEGEFAYKDDIIIANAKGSYVALAKACTHAGTTVKYRENENDFYCDNHKSEFKTDGTVKKSPASDALKVYKTELKDNKLRVTE